MILFLISGLKKDFKERLYIRFLREKLRGHFCYPSEIPLLLFDLSPDSGDARTGGKEVDQGEGRHIRHTVLSFMAEMRRPWSFRKNYAASVY